MKLSKAQVHVLDRLAAGQILERDGWDAPWKLCGKTVRWPTYQVLSEAGLIDGNGGFFGVAKITAKGRRTVSV